jgi:hypothetical protein
VRDDHRDLVEASQTVTLPLSFRDQVAFHRPFSHPVLKFSPWPKNPSRARQNYPRPDLQVAPALREHANHRLDELADELRLPLAEHVDLIG